MFLSHHLHNLCGWFWNHKSQSLSALWKIASPKNLCLVTICSHKQNALSYESVFYYLSFELGVVLNFFFKGNV